MYINKQERNYFQNQFRLYLIRSCYPISCIKNFLIEEGYVPKDREYYIGPMRIDYIQGEPSYRNLCLLHTSVYHRLAKDGYKEQLFPEDFRITEYIIKANNFPKKGFSENLYITLPGILDHEECHEYLEARMNVFEKYNLVERGSYRITRPSQPRKTGEDTRSAFIEFRHYNSLINKTVIKLLLNDSNWNISSNNNTRKYRIKCSWAIDKKVYNQGLIRIDGLRIDGSIMNRDKNIIKTYSKTIPVNNIFDDSLIVRISSIKK